MADKRAIWATFRSSAAPSIGDVNRGPLEITARIRHEVVVSRLLPAEETYGGLAQADRAPAG